MSMPRANRRVGVLINFVSLILLLFFIYIARINGMNATASIGIVVMIIAIFITFVMVFWKTGLWRLVHTKVDKLDERQVMVTHESLRHSYSIFSILCLLVILISEILRQFNLISHDIPLIPFFAVLLYLAHILPASIIAWTEKKI